MKAILSTAVLMSLLISTGCATSHFPTGQTLNRHIYTSTRDLPIAVSIVDLSSGNTLAKWNVPLNKKLVIDLGPDEYQLANMSGYIPAKYVEWAIFNPDDSVYKLPNKRNLPGNPVLIKLTRIEANMPQQGMVSTENEQTDPRKLPELPQLEVKPKPDQPETTTPPPAKKPDPNNLGATDKNGAPDPNENVPPAPEE